MNTELYDALGVAPDATPEEIKRAHRKVVKQHHPDAGGDAQRFGAIQRAYDVLSDPDARQRYDATGSTDTMNREDRIDAMARERFGALLIELIQSDDPFVFRKDWIDHGKRKAQQERHRIEAESKVFAQKRVLAEKLAGRFKTKSPRNIPKDVLAHVTREIDRNLAQAEEKLAVLTRLEELFGEYVFEVDKPDPVTQQTLLRQQTYGTNTTSYFGR